MPLSDRFSLEGDQPSFITAVKKGAVSRLRKSTIDAATTEIRTNSKPHLVYVSKFDFRIKLHITVAIYWRKFFNIKKYFYFSVDFLVFHIDLIFF